MNPPSWVLDTNVIVSGLLVAGGFSGRLVDAILAARLRLSYDDRIEAEYREVLARPHFAISPERREAFLTELKNQDAFVVAGLWPDKTPPDPDDLPFLEDARQTAEQILVTRNLTHFPTSACVPFTAVSVLDALLRWIVGAF